MEKLTNVETMHGFLAAFAKQMMRSEIPKDMWISHLVPVLDDKSREFQAQMPDDQQENFETVKRELLKLHGLGRMHYRQKWEDYAISDEEPRLEAFQRLQRLSNARAMVEPDMLVALLRDKFIYSLNGEEKTHVPTFDPAMGPEAVQLAQNYLAGCPKQKKKPMEDAGGGASYQSQGKRYKNDAQDAPDSALCQSPTSKD